MSNAVLPGVARAPSLAVFGAPAKDILSFSQVGADGTVMGQEDLVREVKGRLRASRAQKNRVFDEVTKRRLHHAVYRRESLLKEMAQDEGMSVGEFTGKCRYGDHKRPEAMVRLQREAGLDPQRNWRPVWRDETWGCGPADPSREAGMKIIKVCPRSAAAIPSKKDSRRRLAE